MNFNNTVLKDEERIAFTLRELYTRYGFLQYKMSKFEEYDLYAKNRDFLVSDNIITFTDTNGRLMALKPDVTLSIVRNTKDIDGYVNKVFYNENVYRVSKGSHAFKEIMQTGLECIGDIDDYNIFETVLLAIKSLAAISSDFILNISHLDLISSVLEEAGLDEAGKRQALRLIANKNMHELRALLEKYKESSKRSAESVTRIFMLNGRPGEVISVLEEEGCAGQALEELKVLTGMLNAAGEGSRVIIDFSVVNNMNYYNGIVFKGYINRVPEAVLSGGRYDRLLEKMDKRSRAVGFAVYLDFLERFFENDLKYDVDAVIRYDDTTDRRMLFNAVQILMNKGMTVTAEKSIPEKLRFKEAFEMDDLGALREIRTDIKKA